MCGGDGTSCLECSGRNQTQVLFALDGTAKDQQAGVLAGLRLGVIVMACFAATFLLAPRVLGSIFTSDPTVLAATVTLLVAVISRRSWISWMLKKHTRLPK